VGKNLRKPFRRPTPSWIFRECSSRRLNRSGGKSRLSCLPKSVTVSIAGPSDCRPSKSSRSASRSIGTPFVRRWPRLVERGAVFKRKGGGSYLVPRFVDHAIGARMRFSANLLLQNREPGHQIIEAAIPGEEDALHLHQTRLMPVLAVDSIGLDLEGMPITLHENRFAATRYNSCRANDAGPDRAISGGEDR
jgi:hypothetical protein